MTFKEIISGLDKLGRSGSEYRRTVCRLATETMEVMEDKLHEASALLKTQQVRIAELEAELKEERYRHDRVQDFEVAEAQELAKLREERRWIPVGERLPEPDKQVLAIVSGRWENITFDRAYELASWSSDEGWIMEAWPELEDPEVTYWMPLPEPPEVDG